MPLAAFLAPILSFLLREVVVRFLVMTAIFVAVSTLMPVALGFVLPFLGVGNLTAVMSAIPPGVWFFWDYFRLDVGLPLMIGAYVARFSVRRLPVIG